MKQLKKTKIILTEKDYSIMGKEIDRLEEKEKALTERQKGTHSQEIELALTQLQETMMRVAKNFNVLISDLTGEPPEEYLGDKISDKDRGKESVQVPLLAVLQQTPDQLRFMTQRIMEIDKRIEYLRGLLIGNPC